MSDLLVGGGDRRLIDGGHGIFPPRLDIRQVYAFLAAPGASGIGIHGSGGDHCLKP